ncbi:MAG: response regulator [Candidatus Tectomicrobia bacterium]|uniref:Response regulator n=1 Tax=Tectimicrobiota bacterium TaxID=2528274 RepID=A0A932FXF2_UNCTE|nr:response regulator [Candidatus Tectomicrobia bacterium]
MAKTRILVVDDEEGILKVCAGTLRKLPEMEIILESQSRRAIERVSSESLDLLVTDIRMPEVDGLELLQIARRHDPSLMVLMLTAFPTVETAVESMRRGAADYLITQKRHLVCHLPLSFEGKRCIFDKWLPGSSNLA